MDQTTNPPRPKQPFNRRLRAEGYDLPSHGPLRAHHERHFASQQRIGIALTIVVFGFTAYGITRDVAQTLWFVGGIVVIVAVLLWLGRRTRIRRLARASR